MADRPIDELDGLTPLQKASTPNMDYLARKGTVGTARTIPGGFPAGSDVANLCILGYDPARYYSGRAPLEAASMGVGLDDTDVAYRCNVVTIDGNGAYEEAVMADYSAGHITTDEARELILMINDRLGGDYIKFYPGVSYRHLMVWKNGEAGAECTPPHDITGKVIGAYLPRGKGQDTLLRLMKESVAILREAEVNARRIAAGKRPANSIWLWGQGHKPSMPDYREKYGLSGALISAVDLTKGLGVYAGFEIIDVPGATGYLDTNYSGKAEYTLNALERVDFIYLHIEAPDEAGHNGNVEDKIRAIEDIDTLVVGPVLKEARNRFGEFRILLMPDHATPIRERTHTDDPVPFAIYDSRREAESGCSGYDEQIQGRDGAMHFDAGHRLMDFFVRGEA